VLKRRPNGNLSGRTRKTLALVLVIVFWVAVLFGLLFPHNDYIDIAAVLMCGTCGCILVLLGVPVVAERRITATFSDDNNAEQETHVGNVALVYGLFYIFLGVLFLCLSVYFIFLQFRG
jgi:hypothetical protein